MAIMNFAMKDSTQYSLKCVNESMSDWVFYVYQKMPDQPQDIFSIVWFASPYRIPKGGGQITFTWSIDYIFFWGDICEVAPGFKFVTGGSVSCDPEINNQTTFTFKDETPRLAPAYPGGVEGRLTIHEGPNVPNMQFVTGIGMSNQLTFCQQALRSTTQIFTPKPIYWVAAATQMQMGQVLAEYVSTTKEIEYPPSVYLRTATLGPDNLWTIS